MRRSIAARAQQSFPPVRLRLPRAIPRPIGDTCGKCATWRPISDGAACGRCARIGTSRPGYIATDVTACRAFRAA